MMRIWCPFGRFLNAELLSSVKFYFTKAGVGANYVMNKILRRQTDGFTLKSHRQALG
jgi:hypothetical protein